MQYVPRIAAPTTSAADPGTWERPLPVVTWIAGLVAIAAANALILATWGVTLLDRTQQLPLVMKTARGDLGAAFAGHAQTSGPGILIVVLPVFIFATLVVSEPQAFDIAALACIVPLAVAAVAASRALGIAARSARELLALAAVVLGVPVLACWIEAFHPADVLAVALCLGAFAAVARGRLGPAAALLGWALATRQWALIAAAVLLVLLDPEDRLRFGLLTTATATALILPFAIAAPGPTADALAAGTVLRTGEMTPILVTLPPWLLYVASRWVPLLLTAGLCLWLHRRRARFTPELAVAAMAAALAFRPLTDPAGFVYYVAPAYACFVLIRPRSLRFPIAGILGGSALLLRATLAADHPVLSPYDDTRVLPGGATLSVLTTIAYLAAIGAALREVSRCTPARPPAAPASGDRP